MKRKQPKQCPSCESKHISFNCTLQSEFDRDAMELEVTSEWLCGECDAIFEFWEQYRVGDLLDSD